jgi:uncharacterized phage protein (TIGR01671 family)
MELKFRAWDEIHNRMWYSNEIGESEGEYGFFNTYEEGCLEFILIRPHPADSYYSEETKLITMQWTGLQDKNGVDIYEKDIIKLDRTNCNEIGIKLHIDMVRRDKVGCYHVDDKRLHHCRLKKCEVVGNVFENPKLLNVDDHPPEG